MKSPALGIATAVLVGAVAVTGVGLGGAELVAGSLAPSAPRAAVSLPQPPPPELIGVARVVDGDTFDTVTGERVRVLGLSSCEARTPGGPRATAHARRLLEGQVVELARQGRVDRDRWGRSLRYVRVNGQDFPAAMVPATHSSVYLGGDARASYVRWLRTLDRNGRDCSR